MDTLTLAPSAPTTTTLAADPTAGLPVAARSVSRPRPARRPAPTSVAEARRALADREREARAKATAVEAARADLARAEAAELIVRGERSLPVIIRDMDAAARAAVEALLVEAAGEKQRPAVQAWFASLSACDADGAGA